MRSDCIGRIQVWSEIHFVFLTWYDIGSQTSLYTVILFLRVVVWSSIEASKFILAAINLV